MNISTKPIKPEPPTPPDRMARVHKEITSSVEEITPEMATRILEAQTDNRPLSDRRVRDYERQIADGRWMVNGEAIIFDWFDRLLNGQHRLWAVFNSGKRVRSVVVRGVDPASFVTIDTGKARDAKDLLSIRGEGNTVVLAGVLRMIWRWEMFEKYRDVLSSRKSIRKTSDHDESPIGKRWGTQMTASPREIEEILTRHPNVRRWVKMSGSQRTIPQTAIAFTMYWLSSVGVKDAEIENFFNFVSEGANMPADDPLFRVHKRFRELKMGRSKGRRAIDTIESVALLVKAWNFSRAGRRIDSIIWRSDEDMPEPMS